MVLTMQDITHCTRNSIAMGQTLWLRSKPQFDNLLRSS